jgi:16S rRNA processing protein RimM
MHVVVGRVAKSHGIGGELAVDVRTDSPDARFALGSVLVARLRDGATRTLTISATRPHGARLLVRFAEIPDRTAADALRGTLLLADTADLPPTEDPDEFYDHELAGLIAVLTDGTEVGTVREVVHGPGGDLLAVELSTVDPDGGQRAMVRESLIPFVKDIVPEVDLVAGRVVLDPPEGLLSL